MSTEQILEVVSTGLEDTLSFAAQIGARLKGGEIIELLSDLGGGKTAFVRGIAQGMGSNDRVHSPSFTISNQYETRSGLTLHHFDFYRLDEPGIMSQEISEVASDPKNVIAVEWPAIIDGILPSEKIKITIKTEGESSRRFIIEYPQKFAYLFPNT